MKVICVTGTPGTGKSTLTKHLVKELPLKRLDLHDHYQKISVGYDKEKQCYDVDLKKLEKLVKEKSKSDNIIIDSHVSHLLPKRMVAWCIVLTCSNLKELERRLKRRGYSKQKIKDNLESEIFQVCLQETKDNGHRLIVRDTSKEFSKEKVVRNIKKVLEL